MAPLEKWLLQLKTSLELWLPSLQRYRAQFEYPLGPNLPAGRVARFERGSSPLYILTNFRSSCRHLSCRLGLETEAKEKDQPLRILGQPRPTNFASTHHGKDCC